MSSAAALALLGLVLATTACDGHREPLRVGINTWPGYEFLYLASEMGFYADEGVGVRVVEFNSLSDARRAYERGQLDALGTTVVEVMQARRNSPRSPQIVYVVDESIGADVILARPELASVADLEGARIGVELGSISSFLLARAMQDSGLDGDAVTRVSMAQSSMFHAFRNGELDAVVTYPPTSVRLRRECDVRQLFSTADIPGEIVDVIAVDAEFIDARPDDVAALLRAYRRAVRYTVENEAEAIGTMAARERISPAEFKAALTDGMRLVGEAEQRDFLRAGGTLERVAQHVSDVLGGDGEPSNAGRRAGAIISRFLPVAAPR